MRKLGQYYNICDFRSVLIYLIYKELLQVKGEHVNISIKRFAWEIGRQYKKRNIIIPLAYEKRSTITDNKGNITQREMGIPALQIGPCSSNTDNSRRCYWVRKLPLSHEMLTTYIVLGALESSVADISRTLKMFILCDPGVQFLGIYPEEAITNVQKKKIMGRNPLCSLPYNNENWETTQNSQ